jgi:streptothricin acetyltransferase
METEIRELGFEALSEYAKIPIAFPVESHFRVDPIDAGLGGFRLTEEEVTPPRVKDYDGYPDGGPERWLKRFDVSNWGLFVALSGARWYGGATVAFHTPALHVLGGRSDLAVLWDLRVHPDFRRHGIGSDLFRYAAQWARQRGCTQLKVETQNVNVPACRFYRRQGCVLGGIDVFGYKGEPEVRDETMFLFYLDL